jgi:hypothetical protein
LKLGVFRSEIHWTEGQTQYKNSWFHLDFSLGTKTKDIKMNSSDGVYMEVPAVRAMAKKCREIADILRAVLKVLEALALMLKVTAFVGQVGGRAAALVVEQFKQFITTLIDNIDELGRDLDVSVTAYEKGDAEGATRFY